MVPPAFASAIGGHPIVADILWQRGYQTVEAARAFLDPDLYAPASPYALPGMPEAVTRLRTAIARGELIRVWGDFDADGQTSTSLLWLGLRALGAQVDYTIPRRSEGSRGLNRSGVERAAADGVRVLLTCDCGVTDFAEVTLARALGLDVIISDHHDLGDGLPSAVAILNPKRLPADHPLAHLPGVGVAYKLMEALYERRSVGAEEQRSGGEQHPGTLAPKPGTPGGLPVSLSPDLGTPGTLPGSPAHLLDLVALGIVADVASQQGDTRYLLQRGLAQLRAHPRPGVRAMLRLTNTDPADLTADGIGYQIGPRLNAVGRLDDAMLAVQLLTTEDEALAATLAAKVEALNQERKVLQRAAEEEAFRQIARDPTMQQRAVIVLTSPSWHPSVLGVVASSVSNRYDRPAVLIALPEGTDVGRGSARSVPGVDIHAAIAAQADLVEASGGHPMAAGFSIKGENVPAFGEALGRYVAAHPAELAPSVDQPEATLAWGDVSLHLADDLERLAPFGPGNRRPLLKSERLRPVRAAPLGSDGKHQMVFLQDGSGHEDRAIWWRSAGQVLPDLCDLIYTIQRDIYQGRSRLQVQVVRMEAPSLAPSTALLGGQFNIIDLRSVPDRAQALQRLLDEHGAANVQVWDELAAVQPKDAPSPAMCEPLTRLQLEQKSVLVIWSAPAGVEELAAALGRVAPHVVALLTPAGQAFGQDRPEDVMQQVVALAKTAQQRGDALDDPAIVARMAARIGQREVTLRAGLEYQRLCAAQDKPAAEKTWRKFVYLVEETRSYRRYFQQAAAGAVLRTSV
jgi:single-stranded-DNA-specific exonuclease